MNSRYDNTERRSGRGMRWAIGLTVAAVLLLGGAVVLRNIAAARTQQQVERFRQGLADADPQRRAVAAAGLLAVYPRDADLHLARAQALIELRRYAEARSHLEPLTEFDATRQTLDPAVAGRALGLLVQAQLLDAVDRVEHATVSSVDLVESELADVLANAEQLTHRLEAFEQQHPAADLPDPGMVRAQLLDLKASLLRLKLRAFAVEQVQQIQSAGYREQLEELAVVELGLKAQLEALHKQIRSLCEARIASGADDAAPHWLMLRLHLRALPPDLEQARTCIEAMIALPTLDQGTAGRAAKRLLLLNEDLGQISTPRDLELAGRLLSRPDLSVSDTGATQAGELEYRHAQALLAFCKGDDAAALQGAEQVLRDYEGHPGALSLQAMVFCRQARADEAVALLQPLAERMPLPSVQYTLGHAYAEANRTEEAEETFRRLLDAAPDHLPARLALIRLKIDAGAILEAINDIAAAVAVNPDHPEVVAAQIALAIHRMDGPSLAAVLDAHGAPGKAFDAGADVPIEPWFAAALARMALDDVAAVDQMLAGDQLPSHLLRSSAKVWRNAEPKQRGMIAQMLIREWIDRLDAARLNQPFPEAPGTHLLSDPDPAEAMLQSMYLPRPLEQALTIVRLAQAQHRDDALLKRLETELQLWLGQIAPGDVDLSSIGIAADSPTAGLIAVLEALNAGDNQAVHERLFGLLSAHPWSELAVLHVIGVAQARSDETLAGSALALARTINPKLAALARARVQLALNRPFEALHEFDAAVQEQVAVVDVEFLYRAAPVRARANLVAGRVELASGEFQNLAMSMPQLKWSLGVAASDVLYDVGRDRQSTATLAALLADSSAMQVPVRTLDAILTRAMARMTPDRLAGLIHAMLRFRENDPILMLYKARCHLAMGELNEARQLVDRAREQHPDALRVRQLQEMVDAVAVLPAEGGAE